MTAALDGSAGTLRPFWARAAIAICVGTLSACYVDTPPSPLDAVATRMIALLQDPTADVRRTAAEALGKLGSPVAGPALTGALRDKDPRVREAVALALGRVGAKGAAAALVVGLDDPQSNVSAASALALGELELGRDRQRDMLKVLASGRTSSRTAASHALLGQSAPQYSPVLVAALNDSDASVRQGAAATLGETGDPRAVTPLAELIERDSDAGVRAECAYRLGKLGDPKVLANLQRVAARDANSNVRRWAEWAVEFSMPRPGND
ncbi:MAG: HEAT repeat domain-containing protein [Nitrospiraceae bacterium]